MTVETSTPPTGRCGGRAVGDFDDSALRARDMGTLFGTDGIRGTVNAGLSAELVVDVGRAVAAACRRGAFGAGSRARPAVVVGRDTRPSGDMLEGALVAGLASAGADTLRAGVVPTAAVAYLVAELGAEAGVVLSASHNPAADNGVKVFGPGGWKLPEATEDVLESLCSDPGELPPADGIGRCYELTDASERYIDHLTSGVATGLGGLRVVTDCAHGAAGAVAPETFRRVGAEVLPLHATLDGERINAGCGATHPEVVARAAAREGIIGLTFDGDADRVLASDETGRIVDGDALIAMLARHLRSEGLLPGDGIVSTVMANQALRKWCRGEGIRLVESRVGDRYVLQALREQDLVLGGEQSGHVIRLDRATTGDGILTALGVLEIVASSGGRLTDLVPFRSLPQVLVNVSTPLRDQWDRAPAAREAVAEAERLLGEDGRVLVRPSGTEPVVRVMVEATSEGRARELAESIAAAFHREMNGGR